MEVTLTRVARFTTKKDGSPLITSKGRPYESVRIQTQEHGERWVSGFGNPLNKDWKAGDKLDLLIEEKNGYLNFSSPTQVKNAPNDAIVARLENFITFKLEPLTVKLQAAIDRLEALTAGIAGETDKETGRPENWEPQFPDGEKM